MAGIDIPFPAMQISIHQPTIKEIAYIGEDTFFTGVELLKITQNILTDEDKSRLNVKTDFDVIMSIMKDRNPASRQRAICAKMVLVLLFPDHVIQVRKDYIAIIKEYETVDENNQPKKAYEEHALNNKNYPDFRQLIILMFSSADQAKSEYNPAGDRAAALAAQFAKGHQKRAQLSGDQVNNSSGVLNRYVSILAVGEQKDINELCQLTVYQLFDEFQRYQLKFEYDATFQAKLAGAKDLKEVDNWMDDIHV